MRQPHELMADDYCGPSKVINLGQIQNRDGFRFIGIDKHGKEHFCIVRKGDGGSFYMNSNTALFEDLCGWLPDPDAPPNVLERRLLRSEDMTENRITELWNKAVADVGDCTYPQIITRFSEFVVLDEREACAKVCESEAQWWRDSDAEGSESLAYEDKALESAARAIRMRSNDQNQGPR